MGNRKEGGSITFYKGINRKSPAPCRNQTHNLWITRLWALPLCNNHYLLLKHCMLFSQLELKDWNWLLLRHREVEAHLALKHLSWWYFSYFCNCLMSVGAEGDIFCSYGALQSCLLFDHNFQFYSGSLRHQKKLTLP